MTPQQAYRLRLGANIRRARNQAGLSLDACADRLPVGKAALGHWEHGRRAVYVKDLAVFADVVDVPVASLVPETLASS